MNNFLIKKSKYISKLLRHDPENLEMNKNGWVGTEELLNKVDINFNQLMKIVKNDNKKRFSLNKDKTKIRANQGHSLDVDVGLKETIPPEFLYHGTKQENLDLILDNGIKKGKRKFVHLSKNIESAEQVGKRHGKPIIFKIFTSEMSKQGYKFYLSENGVWLTNYVPTKFIKKLNS